MNSLVILFYNIDVIVTVVSVILFYNIDVIVTVVSVCSIAYEKQ